MSKEIYDRNIEALKKVSPRTSQYIEDKLDKYKNDKEARPVLDDSEAFSEKGMFEEISIDVERGIDNTPIFSVKKEGVRLYFSEKRDPGKIARVWTRNFDKLPRTSPILLFGIGDGSVLIEINKKVREDVEIYLYEPSLKIFLKCIEEVDLSEVFRKQKMYISLDDNTSYEQIKSITNEIINIANLEFTQRFIFPGYMRLYPKEVKKYLELIRMPMEFVLANHATQAQFSNVIAGTILYNSLYIPDCYMTYQLAHVIPRDIPAIVVAAGPSLNKNIKTIKKAKNRAFIIAVDTAIRPLLNEGIIPDMFAIVDAVKPLKLVDVPGAENIPLLASMASSQAVLAFHTGKKFFYNESFDYVNRIFDMFGKDFKEVASGGSVATTAFALAYMVGIDTIIMVGQDLALTGNKTHADGTFEDKMATIDTSNMTMVPGNVEDKVPTRADFDMYRKWYEGYIKGCRGYRPNLRVINATEGGAKIEGTEVMSLEEAIKENCHREVDIKSLIDGIDPIFSKEERKKVVDYLHKTEAGFRAISKNAKDQIKIYKKIDNMTKTGGIPMKEYKVLLDKLKKYNKKMLKTPYYQLVDDTLIDARLALDKELLVEEDSVLDEAKEIARKGLIYMGLVSECSLLLADVASESVSKAK